MIFNKSFCFKFLFTIQPCFFSIICKREFNSVSFISFIFFSNSFFCYLNEAISDELEVSSSFNFVSKSIMFLFISVLLCKLFLGLVGVNVSYTFNCSWNSLIILVFTFNSFFSYSFSFLISKNFSSDKFSNFLSIFLASSS